MTLTAKRYLIPGLVAGVAVAASEARYANWRPAALPVETQTLLVRKDAKGDGRFGAPRSGNRSHRGVDLAAPLQSPVRAIRSGTVAEVGMHRGLGRYVEIEHAGTLRSVYAHLHETTVSEGERVAQGAVIGAVGKTGNAKHPWIMPHLHLEVWRDGKPVDPQTVGLRVVEPSAVASEVERDESADVGGDE